MAKQISHCRIVPGEIKRGDIFYVNLGSGVGSEQAYVRPCLCIQNDVGNRFSPTTIIAPITSSAKNEQPTHVAISTECGLDRHSTVLCEQIRVIDKCRLERYIGSVKKDKMDEIERALAVSIGLSGYLGLGRLMQPVAEPRQVANSA